MTAERTTKDGPFDPDLAWMCHVCEDERPDAKISVYSLRGNLRSEATVQVNVRYCNDRPSCVRDAPSIAKHWISAWGLTDVEEVG